MCWHIIRWNPKHNAWNNLLNDIDILNSGGSLTKTWSCSGHNCIKNGNGFFLVRQGEEPKGIMGTGFIDNYIQKESGPAIFDARFEILLKPDKESMLTRDYLKYMFPYIYWDTPKTGTVIDNEIAEILYKELLKKTGDTAPQSELLKGRSMINIPKTHVDKLLLNRA